MMPISHREYMHALNSSLCGFFPVCFVEYKCILHHNLISWFCRSLQLIFNLITNQNALFKYISVCTKTSSNIIARNMKSTVITLTKSNQNWKFCSYFYCVITFSKQINNRLRGKSLIGLYTGNLEIFKAFQNLQKREIQIFKKKVTVPTEYHAQRGSDWIFIVLEYS